MGVAALLRDAAVTCRVGSAVSELFWSLGTSSGMAVATPNEVGVEVAVVVPLSAPGVSSTPSAEEAAVVELGVDVLAPAVITPKAVVVVTPGVVAPLAFVVVGAGVDVVVGGGGGGGDGGSGCGVRVTGFMVVVSLAAGDSSWAACSTSCTPSGRLAERGDGSGPSPSRSPAPAWSFGTLPQRVTAARDRDTSFPVRESEN